MCLASEPVLKWLLAFCQQFAECAQWAGRSNTAAASTQSSVQAAGRTACLTASGWDRVAGVGCGAADAGGRPHCAPCLCERCIANVKRMVLATKIRRESIVEEEVKRGAGQEVFLKQVVVSVSRDTALVFLRRCAAWNHVRPHAPRLGTSLKAMWPKDEKFPWRLVVSSPTVASPYPASLQDLARLPGVDALGFVVEVRRWLQRIR